MRAGDEMEGRYPHRRDAGYGVDCRCAAMSTVVRRDGELWGGPCPVALREALALTEKQRDEARLHVSRVIRERDAQVEYSDTLAARVAELEAALTNAHAQIDALTVSGIEVLQLYTAQPTDDLQVVASAIDYALRWNPERSAVVDQMLTRENLYAADAAREPK